MPTNPYMLNLTHPEVERIYKVYRQRQGVPLWCPFSDQEREAFELFFMNMRTQPDYARQYQKYISANYRF